MHHKPESRPLSLDPLSSSFSISCRRSGPHKQLLANRPRLLQQGKIRRTRRRTALAGAKEILQRHHQRRPTLLIRGGALIACVVVKLHRRALHLTRRHVLVQRGEEAVAAGRASARDEDLFVGGGRKTVTGADLLRSWVATRHDAKIRYKRWVYGAAGGV